MTGSKQGVLNQRDVEFTSGGVVLRGWLRTPDTAAPYPLVILAHGLGGLKEWTIPDVASALVDAGIAALAFDYRNFGDSDGLPREEVDHSDRSRTGRARSPSRRLSRKSTASVSESGEPAWAVGTSWL